MSTSNRMQECPEGATRGADDFPGRERERYPPPWLERALREVPAAVRQLPAEEQRVIVAHFFEESPVALIAEELRLDPLRVRSILASALRTLREELRG